MQKSVGHLVALGSILFLNSAYAQTPGLDRCPESINSEDLRRIAAIPQNNNVEWKGATWTITINSVDVKKLTEPVTIVGTPSTTGNTLSCYYSISCSTCQDKLNPVIFGLALSTTFTGATKKPL